MLELIKFGAKGFGCFKDETIFDFQSGINMIVAENGKGKSTMIQGIEMLLLSEALLNFGIFFQLLLLHIY